MPDNTWILLYNDTMKHVAGLEALKMGLLDQPMISSIDMAEERLLVAALLMKQRALRSSNDKSREPNWMAMLDWFGEHEPPAKRIELLKAMLRDDVDAVVDAVTDIILAEQAQ